VTQSRDTVPGRYAYVAHGPTGMFLRTLARRYHHNRALRVEPELAVVRRLLPEGGWLVDVGANHGSYVDAGLLAGACVTAIEPQPELVAALVRRYRSESVEVVHAAAAPGADGHAELYQPLMSGVVLDSRSSLRDSSNTGFEQQHITVPTRSLDRIVTQSRFSVRQAAAHAPAGPDVVKIDVEGFEVDVLRSASELIGTARPAVLIEVERRHHPGEDPWEAFRVLEGHGYRGWYLDNGQTHPLAQFDPDTHQPLGVVKDPSAKGRPLGLVNNFLFLHPERHTALPPT